MSKLREAAAAALEALELSTPKARTEDDYAEQGWKEHHAAITALKAALAEPQDKPVAWRYRPFPSWPWSLTDDGYYAGCKRDSGYAVETLYTHPAPQRQPQDEPVTLIEELRLAGLALIGLAEHDQHCDVFDLDDEGKHKECSCGYAAAISVITRAGKTATAPQRQPLTEDEAWDMWEALADRGKKGEDIVHAFARAIERAHGIGGQDEVQS